MKHEDASVEVIVRLATPADEAFAVAASLLIEDLAGEYDIARRKPAFLAKKILGGQAALALIGEMLVGFGYWSDWENGKFISHSGLVVRRDQMGAGLGRRLKVALFESSRKRFPKATLMSLTNSPQVRALNRSLGFHVVPLSRLTKDPAFWEGCKTCRNYCEVQTVGERCCCEGMILEPEP